MKKLITLALLSFSLFGCSNSISQDLTLVQEQNTVNASSSGFGKLIDSNNTLKKDLTLKQISNNSIVVKPDDINRDKNTLVIRFSKGDISNGSNFHVVMSVKIDDDKYGKRGDSYMNVESSYFQGFILTKDEAYKLLKSSTNYRDYASKFDKIYK